MPSTRFAAAALACVLLAACGGGSSSHAVPAANMMKEGSAVVRLTIPAATTASTHRSPRYVSASTQSLLITVQSVNNAPTAFPAIALNVVVGSSTCPLPTQGGQNETCTFPVVLPVGNVQFTVTAYDHTLTGTTPAGNPLSSSTVVQNLTGNGDPILLTLNGVPVHATLYAGTSPLPIGTAAAITVTASALDADNNLIIGPGSYTTPIVVAVTDPLGRISVGQASIAGPGATAALTYNGGAGLLKATINGSASGVTVVPTTVSFVPGLVRSDALAQITSPVHYLAVSPDGSTAAIPYQDASNANAPTLLLVSVATRAVTAHPQLVSQSPNATAMVENVSFAPAGPTAYVGYSDTLNVNGFATVNTTTGIVAASTSLPFAPQYLTTAANTPNLYAFGTPPSTPGSGTIENFSTTGTVNAAVGTIACAVDDQCVLASKDGAFAYAPDSAGDMILTMKADGTQGPSIATPDGPVTAQIFSPNGQTQYVASAQSGGGTSLDTLTYPISGSPVNFTTLATQFSALAISTDASTLFGSSSITASPLTLIDIASKTVVSFGPSLTLGQFAGAFISPVSLATSGSRRFLVIRQYQQPAGTTKTTLDEYVY